MQNTGVGRSAHKQTPGDKGQRHNMTHPAAQLQTRLFLQQRQWPGQKRPGDLCQNLHHSSRMSNSAAKALGTTTSIVWVVAVCIPYKYNRAELPST